MANRLGKLIQTSRDQSFAYSANIEHLLKESRKQRGSILDTSNLSPTTNLINQTGNELIDISIPKDIVDKFCNKAAEFVKFIEKKPPGNYQKEFNAQLDTLIKRIEIKIAELPHKFQLDNFLELKETLQFLSIKKEKEIKTEIQAGAKSFFLAIERTITNAKIETANITYKNDNIFDSFKRAIGNKLKLEDIKEIFNSRINPIVLDIHSDIHSIFKLSKGPFDENSLIKLNVAISDLVNKALAIEKMEINDPLSKNTNYKLFNEGSDSKKEFISNIKALLNYSENMLKKQLGNLPERTINLLHKFEKTLNIDASIKTKMNDPAIKPGLLALESVSEGVRHFFDVKYTALNNSRTEYRDSYTNRVQTIFKNYEETISNKKALAEESFDEISRLYKQILVDPNNEQIIRNFELIKSEMENINNLTGKSPEQFEKMLNSLHENLPKQAKDIILENSSRRTSTSSNSISVDSGAITITLDEQPSPRSRSSVTSGYQTIPEELSKITKCTSESLTSTPVMRKPLEQTEHINYRHGPAMAA